MRHLGAAVASRHALGHGASAERPHRRRHLRPTRGDRRIGPTDHCCRDCPRARHRSRSAVLGEPLTGPHRRSAGLEVGRSRPWLAPSEHADPSRCPPRTSKPAGRYGAETSSWSASTPTTRTVTTARRPRTPRSPAAARRRQRANASTQASANSSYSPPASTRRGDSQASSRHESTTTTTADADANAPGAPQTRWCTAPPSRSSAPRPEPTPS